jgi:hypothetical protein
MKLINFVICSFIFVLASTATGQATAETPDTLPSEPPAAQDSTQFNHDLDEFEKNMAKEVPNAKKPEVLEASAADRSSASSSTSKKKKKSKKASKAKKSSSSKKPKKKKKKSSANP